MTPMKKAVFQRGNYREGHTLYQIWDKVRLVGTNREYVLRRNLTAGGHLDLMSFRQFVQDVRTGKLKLTSSL